MACGLQAARSTWTTSGPARPPSSTSGRRRLPGVKIDRSLLVAASADDRDLAVFARLIDMAHALSLRVVVEGIDSRSLLSVACAAKADLLQGYLLAEPMSEQELMERADFGSGRSPARPVSEASGGV